MRCQLSGSSFVHLGHSKSPKHSLNLSNSPSPEDKVAAEVPAPLELVGHVVVGQVPAGVLHQRHGDPGVGGDESIK